MKKESEKKQSEQKRPDLETEGLLLGIRLAEEKMRKKKFRGNSANRSVSIRIHGDHSPDEVQISAKDFGIDDDLAKQISAAIKEALGRAIGNAQSSATKILDKEL